MENNDELRQNRPSGGNESRPVGTSQDAAHSGDKRRRTHRGGRRHHGGNRPAGDNADRGIGDSRVSAPQNDKDTRRGGTNAAQAQKSRPQDNRTQDGGQHKRNNEGGHGNGSRSNRDDRSADRTKRQNQGDSRRSDRGGKPNRPSSSDRPDRRSSRPPVPEPPVHPSASVSVAEEAFPFAAETDTDPAAVLDFPGLTAENYLDDPLCFAGKTPIPAVRKPSDETDGKENGTEVPAEKPAFATAPVTEIIGVQFRGNGKVYYFAPGSVKSKPGDHVIVETVRGQEYGDVVFGNRFIPADETVSSLRPVLRAADENDARHDEDNHRRETEAFRICRGKIAEHKLDMKLVEAQYTFDNSKLLFYFTSDGRVDFRDLVKDLAGAFHTRIELRQIGIRDEAKLLGGLGVCGRPLCCSSFLSDFGQVSIKMAKEQNLSLNSAKISGICGRLMCCLRYEHEVYAEEIRLTPPVDTMVRTADGIGRVTAINPLLGTVRVFLTDSPDTPQKMYHRDNVEVLSRGDGDRPAGRAARKTDRPAHADTSARKTGGGSAEPFVPSKNTAATEQNAAPAEPSENTAD